MNDVCLDGQLMHHCFPGLRCFNLCFLAGAGLNKLGEPGQMTGRALSTRGVFCHLHKTMPSLRSRLWFEYSSLPVAHPWMKADGSILLCADAGYVAEEWE